MTSLWVWSIVQKYHVSTGFACQNIRIKYPTGLWVPETVSTGQITPYSMLSACSQQQAFPKSHAVHVRTQTGKFPDKFPSLCKHMKISFYLAKINELLSKIIVNM